jgi:ribosomal protein S12 methylthiotransferase
MEIWGVEGWAGIWYNMGSMKKQKQIVAKKSLALVSLGCAKNAVDLQVMAGNLLKEGFYLSSNPDEADVVIVNTCAFIESAREEAEAEIVRALELKRRGAYGRVIVTGCYPERYPRAAGKFPGVDVWKGVPKDWVETKTPGLRFTGKAFAYLKIAEGCAHRCAYCAIPGIRGKYRSRPVESIIAEAKALIRSGCRELNVVAQDPMLYGIDMKGGWDLVRLLWKLDKIGGDFWVRVLYSYPNEITEGFLEWLNRSKHAAKYVDVPLQHTDEEVLRRMNRGAAIEATRVAAEALRLAVPGVTLRTTIMTGFPGETVRRFRGMMADLKRMQFDHVGAFAFSPEEGTKAAKMGGRPSRKVAEAREKDVMELAKAIWRVRARRQIGTVQRALVIAPGVARLESQAPDVDGICRGEFDEVGEFIWVQVKAVKGFDFEVEEVEVE